jgi:hypothetical protein
MINAAVADIMAGNRIEAATTDVTSLQLAVQDRMIAILRNSNMITVSDIYGGITNNAVIGNTRRRDPYYWFDSKGNATYKQQIEFFAGHFSSAIRGNAEELTNEELYLSESSRILSDIIDEMTRR